VPRQQTPSESVSHPKGVTLKAVLWRLQRHLDSKLATLKGRITPDSVHKVRTAARRVHALLHGFRAKLSPSLAHRYRYCLKQVTRELGGLRDAELPDRLWRKAQRLVQAR
jgi:CHAD domain-containing protein